MLEDIDNLYLGGGDPPPKGGFRKVYHTPIGLYPKLVDVALKYGLDKSTVSRTYFRPKDTYKEWYIIWRPTKTQVNQAIRNANSLHIAENLIEDNCGLCDLIDDMLFLEGCWLLNVVHDHKVEDVQGIYSREEEIVIYYSHRKETFKVNYNDWLVGKRPHLKEGVKQ